MRVFDVHVHYRFATNQPESGHDTYVENLVAKCAQAGIAKACLLGSRWGDANPWVERAAKLHPKLFIPMYGLNMDTEGADIVSQAHERGFRGLKLIAPHLNYDDDAYMPVYWEANRLGMVLLFHTGVLGGPVDLLLEHPHDDKVLDERFKQYEAGPSRRGVSSTHMQPIFLDTLGFAFPRLRIIGAHMGAPWYDDAFAVARWRRYVYFDVSGGELMRQHAVRRQFVPGEVSPEKLVYGSDCSTERLDSEIAAWQTAFDELELPTEDRDKIFYRNAARLFGIAD